MKIGKGGSHTEMTRSEFNYTSENSGNYLWIVLVLTREQWTFPATEQHKSNCLCLPTKNVT